MNRFVYLIVGLLCLVGTLSINDFLDRQARAISQSLSILLWIVGGIIVIIILIAGLILFVFLREWLKKQALRLRDMEADIHLKERDAALMITKNHDQTYFTHTVAPGQYMTRAGHLDHNILYVSVGGSAPPPLTVAPPDQQDQQAAMLKWALFNSRQSKTVEKLVPQPELPPPLA